MSNHCHPPRTSVPLNENANILSVDPSAERLREYLLTWCEVAEGKLPPRALKSVGLSRLPTLPNELHPGWLLALGNDSFGALNHLGGLLDKDPQNPDTQLLSSICLQRVKNYTTSSAMLASLIKMKDVYAPYARHYLANALLSVGKLNQGFRYLGPGNRPLTELEKQFFTSPEKLWSGQKLNNEKLVIVGNSELIDELFYLRFIRTIRELFPAATISFVCSKEVVDLAETVNCIDHATDQPSDDFDYFLPIEYLPSIVAAKTGKVPAQISLKANRKEIKNKQARLLSHKPTLGIKWRDDEPQASTAIEGRAVETNRNLDIPSLQSLLEQVDDQFQIVCLQKDLSVEEKYLLSSYRATFIDDTELSNFSSLSEWLSALDQIITVDCSLVELVDIHHLSAAVMLPYSQNWRWNANNWHPTQSKFKKISECSWAETIGEVSRYLTAATVDSPPAILAEAS